VTDLIQKAKAALVKFSIGQALGGSVDKIKAVVVWLNAAPGRKRGLSAILLGVAAALRGVGKLQVADTVDAINAWSQTYLVPNMEVVGALVGLWGYLHDRKRAKNNDVWVVPKDGYTVDVPVDDGNNR
jgi:hypothetical protein